MTRDEIIAKLAAAFGPHLAPVPRDTGNPRRDRGRVDYVPDGNNERGSAMTVFLDTDGHNSMRPLTYGDIADALADPDELPAPAVSVIEVSPQEGRAMFDQAARDELGISGETFLRQWDAGDFEHCMAANRVAMLMPFAREEASTEQVARFPRSL